MRGELLGIQDAATLVGYRRTQMWRDACDGKVGCIVEGTQERPVYRFWRMDLLEYKQRRDVQKDLERQRAERRKKRKLQSREEQARLRLALAYLGSMTKGLRRTW